MKPPPLLWPHFHLQWLKKKNLKTNFSSGKKKKIHSHRIKRNLHWIFKITNKWHVPNHFLKKMYTGWVMSIERQGNQDSTSPDTMCVVPYIAFCVQCLLLYQDSAKFMMILMNLAVHTNTYMLHDQLFLIHSTPFLSQCNRITRTDLYL